MTKASPSSTNRWLGWAGTIVGVVLWLYFLPLFHVVPLKTAGPASAEAVFDASAYVEKFWTERLLRSRDRAVDAKILITALHENPDEAARQYGRRLGVSRTSCYLLAGTGRILTVQDDTVAITLGKESTTPDVVIELGPVFGNAIRDGSGLLDVSDFLNSQDFNALSAELNRRVEERVFPQLKKLAAPGVTLRFFGCAEVTGPETDTRPLRLVPIQVETP